jgi:hypothetical protein
MCPELQVDHDAMMMVQMGVKYDDELMDDELMTMVIDRH